MAHLDSNLAPLIASAARHLRNARGVVTVGDLLRMRPTRYLSYDSEVTELRDGEFVVLIGTIKSAHTRSMSTRKGSMLTAVLTDGHQDVDMTFFNARAHENKLLPGVRVIAGGQVGTYNHRRQLAHPGYTLLDEVGRGRAPAHRLQPEGAGPGIQVEYAGPRDQVAGDEHGEERLPHPVRGGAGRGSAGDGDGPATDPAADDPGHVFSRKSACSGRSHSSMTPASSGWPLRSGSCAINSAASARAVAMVSSS